MFGFEINNCDGTLLHLTSVNDSLHHTNDYFGVRQVKYRGNGKPTQQHTEILNCKKRGRPFPCFSIYDVKINLNKSLNC